MSSERAEAQTAPEDTAPAEETAAPDETPPAEGAAAEEQAATPAPPAEEAAEAVIELRGLSVRVPGKTLLEGVDLTVRRGERVLLVGPSGAGKSVLLRLLTGLLPRHDDYSFAGSARLAGLPLVTAGELLPPDPAVHDRVGIVFQDHALLDELTAEENLLFARDHAASARAFQATERALGFLKQHGIQPTARVRALSGGQKQRVAVARALARDPGVVFYDEPTSALDPHAARAVAELIRDASASTTSVVVTHDYAPFREVATRVLLLDPTRRALREVDWDEVDAFFQSGAGTAVAAAEPAPPPAPLVLDAARRARDAVLDVVAGTPAALRATARAVPYAVFPARAQPQWLARWFAHYARIAFFGSALPYNVIAGVIAGFVATYFTYKFLPRPELTEALILDDILPALGFALYRIVVPVLVTILVAGRTGAALASDFGNRVYHHQTLAMRSLGAPAGVYLGTAALWASLVGVLVVAAVAFWSAALTSLTVFTVIQPDLTPFYWEGQFWRRLEPWSFLFFGKGWGWVLGKLLVSAGGVAGISYAIGSRPKRSTAEVSRGITLSVYWGTVFVLLVHFVAAFFEFERLRHTL